MATITAEDADRLFGRLRTAFIAVETALADIIAARAWEPLGYASLAEAWADRMKGVKLTGATQAYVAFALLDSGATVDDITTAVDGMGPRTARALVDARAAGMTAPDAAKHASYAARTPRMTGEGTVVRAHVRKPPTRRNGVTLHGFTDDEMTRWKVEAGARGIDFPTWCRDLLRDALNAEVAANA